jgi:hypothetical protein
MASADDPAHGRAVRSDAEGGTVIAGTIMIMRWFVEENN